MPRDDFRFSARPNRAHEIAWRPWGPEAFAEARAQSKPVLLSISAVWCHWCHVMDEGTYSDPEVIAAVNERFVPVRVDNDRRPDLNRRYNMGGWPTTAFLTSGGAVLSGATYLPAEQMLTILERVADFYARHESTLRDARTDDRDEGRKVEIGVGAGGAEAPPAPTPPADRLSEELVADVTRKVAALYDPLYGGLGAEPKFPQPDALSLLLVRGLRSNDERLREMALSSLAKMGAGDVYDHVAEGFFRYATRRDWSEPHYEKMLEDNARLLLLYLDAWAASGDEALRTTAEGIIECLMGTLRQQDRPAFSGSQDADEEYYRLGADARGERGAPPIDETVYVDWNALTARGLLRASYLLERPGLAAAACETLDLLWDETHGQSGMAHYLGGPVAGLLADQAAVLTALLDAAEVLGEWRHRDRAGELADWILAHLVAPDGRFYDRVPAADDAGHAGEPLPVLEGGAEAADALMRLARVSGHAEYREAAAKALAAYAGDVPDHGAFAAAYALAVTRFLEHPTHVAVVGRRDDPVTLELVTAALALGEPLRTVQLLDPGEDAAAIAREGYAGTDTGVAGGAGAVAYVCAGTTCHPPTTDPGEIATLAGHARAPAVSRTPATPPKDNDRPDARQQETGAAIDDS